MKTYTEAEHPTCAVKKRFQTSIDNFQVKINLVEKVVKYTAEN